MYQNIPAGTPWINVKDLDGNITNMATLPDLGHDLVRSALQYFEYSHDYVNDYSIPDRLVYYMFGRKFYTNPPPPPLQEGNQRFVTHHGCIKLVSLTLPL